MKRKIIYFGQFVKLVPMTHGAIASMCVGSPRLGVYLE